LNQQLDIDMLSLLFNLVTS